MSSSKKMHRHAYIGILCQRIALSSLMHVVICCNMPFISSDCCNVHHPSAPPGFFVLYQFHVVLFLSILSLLWISPWSRDAMCSPQPLQETGGAQQHQTEEKGLHHFDNVMAAVKPWQPWQLQLLRFAMLGCLSQLVFLWPSCFDARGW